MTYLGQTAVVLVQAKAPGVGGGGGLLKCEDDHTHLHLLQTFRRAKYQHGGYRTSEAKRCSVKDPGIWRGTRS